MEQGKKKVWLHQEGGMPNPGCPELLGENGRRVVPAACILEMPGECQASIAKGVKGEWD